MLYPLIDSQKWSETYSLKIESVQCVCCKKYFTANIPVAFESYRGFQIADHGCSPEYNYAYFICVSEEKNREWDGLVGNII